MGIALIPIVGGQLESSGKPRTFVTELPHYAAFWRLWLDFSKQSLYISREFFKLVAL